MAQHLILMAMGADRLGIISDITQLTSDCGCNIVDSRMALFGNEFTLTILLTGTPNAITQIENRFPVLAVELDLMTIMKRTLVHNVKKFSKRILVHLSGQDSPGVLKEITNFLVKNHVQLFSFKAVSVTENQQMETSLEVALADDANVNALKNDFYTLCEKLKIHGQLTTTNIKNN